MLGADRLVWGSDYPHGEGHTDPLGELTERIVDLSEEEQRQIIGENAVNLYGLDS